MRVKKQYLLIIFHVITFIILFTLGSWQLVRLEWKTKLINNFHIHKQQSSIFLPNNIDITKDEFLKVKLIGKFDFSRALFMFSTYDNKNIAGYYVFNPFITNDGRRVLVNRGWIPAQEKDNLKQFNKYNLPLEGIILKIPPKSLFMPGNDFKNKILTHLNINEINKFYNSNLENYYIAQIKNSSSFPLTKIISPDFHNFHLIYAITWFCLAFISLFFFKLAFQKRQ